MTILNFQYYEQSSLPICSMFTTCKLHMYYSKPHPYDRLEESFSTFSAKVTIGNNFREYDYII